MCVENKDKVSRAIAILSAIFAGFSLIISIVAAWYTFLSPANLTGSISYLVLWRFSSNNDGKVTDRKLTPSFWIGNIGARPIIIEDIRVVFKSANGTECLAYPVCSVPLEAINSSGEFNQYGRLSLGGPFRGFSLAHSEQWISSHHYNLSEECYNKLVGQIDISVEVKSQGNNRWENVIQDNVDFGKKPFHLQKMIGGIQSIPIYTEKWKMRKK